MSRVKAGVLVFLILSITLFNCGIGFGAVSEDFKSFRQNDPQWYLDSNGSMVKIGNSQYTLKSSGCAVTSVTTLMAYANPELRDSTTWNPREACRRFSFSGGGIYWDSPKNVDPTFTLVSVLMPGGKHGQDAVNYVKQYMDQGYYVVVCANGIYDAGTHYSPIVGWRDNKPVVHDTAGTKTWDDWARCGLTKVVVYRSSINGSREAFAECAGGGTTDSSGHESYGNSNEELDSNLSDEMRAEIQRFIQESELRGMNQDPTYLLDQSALTLSDGTSLSQLEKNALNSISDGIESQSYTFVKVFNIFLNVVGIACILYGVLMLIAMLFDYSNNFIEISLLKVLTFGRYRLVDKDYFDKNKLPTYNKEKGYANVTVQMCLIRIVVVELIGFLILSGVIQKML